MQAAIKKQPGSRARKPECGSRNGSEISEIREGREAPPIAIRFLMRASASVARAHMVMDTQI